MFSWRNFNSILFSWVLLWSQPHTSFADFEEIENESDYKRTIKNTPPIKKEIFPESDRTLSRDKSDTTEPQKEISPKSAEDKKGDVDPVLLPTSSTVVNPKVPASKKPEAKSDAQKEPPSEKAQQKDQTKTKELNERRKTKPLKPKPPIKMKSDGLKGSRAGGEILLKQNVRINQGDLSIACDEASILFDKTGNDIDKVVANGRVKLKRYDPFSASQISASASKMTYDQKKMIIVLDGNVTINRGGDIIKGKQLVYDMNTGWISGKKIDGLVSPKSEQ